MIIACPSCPAQYSVPDAKLRGRKVRVTCKHCGGAIIVDASEHGGDEGPSASQLERLPASAPAHTGVSDTDATRVMPARGEVSVHEEKTVVGEVPRELLEAEKRFSQRTLPPAAQAAELPLDKTGAATPAALRASSPSLPPQPSAEVKTLLSRSEPLPASRSWRWWTLGAVLLLLLLLLLLRQP